MSRDPIPSWFFVLVVVRRGDEFLVVQEAKHGERWYLPAGRVEPGETFVQAAERETLEEAGIPIKAEGILRIEHTPTIRGNARVRAVLLARPASDAPPKSVPDTESLGARWVRVGDLGGMPMRGSEVEAIFRYVSSGPLIVPVSLITTEGAPYGV